MFIGAFWERGGGPSGMSVRGDAAAAAAAAALQGPSGRPRPSLWLFYLLPIDGVDLTSRFVKPRRIDGGLLYRSARSCSGLCVSPSLHKQRSVRGQKYVKLIFFFFFPLFFFFYARRLNAAPAQKGNPDRRDESEHESSFPDRAVFYSC